jgi:hypothetical protein
MSRHGAGLGIIRGERAKERIQMNKGKTLKAHGNETFRTVTETLNELFKYKISRAGRGGYEIKPGKIVTFIHQAVKRNGNWVPPNKKILWLNKPDDDGKRFTREEVPINAYSYVHSFPDREFAVFMKYDGLYHFYGIFERGIRDAKTGKTIFTRISKDLNLKEWQV